MRIDDFCCLGRTVPEESKKYGRKVCMAGYSDEMRSLVRVYPLPVQNPIHARRLCVLELERSNHDNRGESWRLMRERDDAGIVSVSESALDTARVVAWMEGHLSPSIAQLNKQRLSLGVIKPAGLRGYFRDRSIGDAVDPDQRTLFDDLDDSFGGGVIQRAPYLRFADEAGSHDLQLREWGCYEWLRKEPDRASQLWRNLRIAEPGRDVYLVVGNMCNRRNVWLVISVFSQASAGPLFDAGGR
jgi:hypothetical protein